jgi:hypothetical protein
MSREANLLSFRKSAHFILAKETPWEVEQNQNQDLVTEVAKFPSPAGRGLV